MTRIEENDGDSYYTGPLQCFCRYEKKKKRSMKKEYQKRDDEGNVEFIDEICYEVRFNYYWSNTIGILISFLIIFINSILNQCVVALVIWVGDESVSKQRSLMVKAIFYT